MHHNWTLNEEGFIETPIAWFLENIRETVVQYAIDHSMDRFDLFSGISIKDAVRSSYVTSASPSLINTDDAEYSPRSWREWYQAMLLDTTYADSIITKVAALALNVQIVFIDEHSAYHVMNPDKSTLRVFIHITNFKHFHWAHPSTQRCTSFTTCSRTRSFELRIPAASLDFNLSGRSDLFPRSLESSTITAEHTQWLHESHCGYTGHPGTEATVQLLRKANHDWIGITKDARAFIKQCPTCTLSRIRQYPALTMATQLRVTDRPLSRWHADHCDLPRCHHTHFRAICILVCEVTGFTWLTGSRYKSALETAMSLVSLSALFNAPDSFHTDGGPEFDNSVLSQLAAVTGFKHTFSIANAPNSNGIAERNVATSSRFIRLLSLDLGRMNSWGLVLGLIIQALNSLPRHALGGASPNDIVFASLRSHDPAVIPTVYSSPIPTSVLDSANKGHVATNFAERALCTQQIITNTVCEYYDSLLQKSAEQDPIPAEQLKLGQQVLIDWTGDYRPDAESKLHARLRGPYTIVAVHNNTLTLHHVHYPPPPNQPAKLTWSTHARVYICEHEFERSALDPSASQVAINSSAFSIECILEHQLVSNLPDSTTSHPDFSNFDVHHQLFKVRYHHSSAPGFVRTAWRSYDDIAHTLAMDNYTEGNPHLHSHRPICAMPSTWKPTLPAGHSAHAPPVPLNERHLLAAKKAAKSAPRPAPASSSPH